MPSIKEILAAKKAAAEQASASSTVTEQLQNKEVIVTVEYKEEAAKEEEKPVSMIAAETPAPAPASPPASDKPLSFAEKMALKKAQIAAEKAANPPPPEPEKKELPPLEIDPESIPDDPELAQAYVDIKTRIHNLEQLFDDNLSSAMSELKVALKKNPAASELILDTDVGKMVTALRRMRHIALVENKKEKKPGRTSKPKAVEVALTEEQLAAAWNEL